jgi:hypothetical protein
MRGSGKTIPISTPCWSTLPPSGAVGTRRSLKLKSLGLGYRRAHLMASWAGSHCGTTSTGDETRAAPPMCRPRPPQCQLLRVADRLPMAIIAARPAEVVTRVPLLPPGAAAADVGPNSRAATHATPRRSGTRGPAECWDHRQPTCEDDWEASTGAKEEQPSSAI